MKVYLIALLAFLIFAGTVFSEEKASKNLLGTDVSKESGWTVFIHPDYKKAEASVTYQDNQVIVTTGKSDRLQKKMNYAQQVIKTVALEKDVTYQLSFTTQSETGGKLFIYYILNQKPYTPYAGRSVELVAGKHQKHVLKITPKAVKDVYSSHSSLRFFCGEITDGKLIINATRLSRID